MIDFCERGNHDLGGESMPDGGGACLDRSREE